MGNSTKLAKIAVIAEDSHLAEKVCSHFRSIGTYLPLFEAPPIRLEEFGVFSSDCVEISNAIRALQPQTTLLVGCQPRIRDELRRHLPPATEIIELDDYDEGKLSVLPHFRRTVVDASLFQSQRNGFAHVIAVEAEQPMALVIARNLAVAHSASIHLMPAVPDDLGREKDEQLRKWAVASGYEKDEAKDGLLGFIREQLGALATSKVASISFITREVAYGIYPLSCPTTHYFSFPLLGVNVLNGMVKTQNPTLRCPVAVLIDPGRFETTEFSGLRHFFKNAGYVIRDAVGAKATAMDARYLTEYMPSDFLLYATDCGEVRGRRITEEFTTQGGAVHQITYDLVKSLSSSPTPGLVEVQDMYRFVAMDGVSWSDREGKKRIGAGDVMKEFLTFTKQRGGDPAQYHIVHSSESEFVKSSDSLQMHDFVYSPMPQQVGGHRHPLVFYNACSSWREMSMRYGCYGASVYIGTSLDVLNSLAIRVGTQFARDIVAGKAAGPAIFNAQKTFVRDNGYTPYLMHGYLFTAIKPLPCTAPPAPGLVALKIREEMDIYSSAPFDEHQKREWESVLTFLNCELNSLANATITRKR